MGLTKKLKNDLTINGEEFGLSIYFKANEIGNDERIEEIIKEESKTIDYREEARKSAKSGNIRTSRLNLDKLGWTYRLNGDYNMPRLIQEDLNDFLNLSIWDLYSSYNLRERVNIILNDEGKALSLREMIKKRPNSYFSYLKDRIVWDDYALRLPKRAYNLAEFVVRELLETEKEGDKRNAADLLEELAERVPCIDEITSRKLFEESRLLYDEVGLSRKVAEISQKIGWTDSYKKEIEQKIYESEKNGDLSYARLLADSAGMTFKVVELLKKEGHGYDAARYAERKGLYELTIELYEGIGFLSDAIQIARREGDNSERSKKYRQEMLIKAAELYIKEGNKNNANWFVREAEGLGEVPEKLRPKIFNLFKKLGNKKKAQECR